MTWHPCKAQPLMASPIEFETERLHLRQWRHTDYEPFADLNADPQAMAFLPHPLPVSASDALAHRNALHIAERGWGLWAAQDKVSQEFIGFIGLQPCAVTLPFAPAVELVWRISPLYWGRGLATEGARGAQRVGFEQLGLREIVAFTAVSNLRSQGVMRRLGMREAGRFEHPALPGGHPLRAHALFRMSRENYDALRGAATLVS